MIEKIGNKIKEKSKKLISKYTDEQLEEFKIELRKLSDKYYIVK